MAKAQLTDVERFYIRENPEKLSIAELAKKFGRAANTIINIINKFKKEPIVEQPVEQLAESPVPQPTGPVTGPNARRAFGHVRKRGQSLATVMTQAASELGDEAGKLNRRSINDIPALRNAIHRPYGNDPAE